MSKESRTFWSVFLGVEVAKDGSVPGFRRWWDGATDYAKSRATVRECEVVASVRRGVDLEEAVVAAIRGLKEDLRYAPPEPRMAARVDAEAMIATIIKGLG